MDKKIKYACITIIAVILFAPIIQFCWPVFKEKPLEGDITIAQKPKFSSAAYWSLNWQEDYTKYYNDNFGFRNTLVRSINQVRYSVFNTTKAPGVVIGKENNLFIESYIDEYIGRNYKGANAIAETVRKIKSVQDTLKSRNIDLIIVFAPGKASYHSEFIPARYLKRKKDSTNYHTYSEAFIKNQINFIDLNKWFVVNKNKFPDPIYPKYGTHWNHYGMSVGLDTIIRYIEKKRNINLPDFDYSLRNYTNILEGSDFDIGVMMNLLKPIDKDINPYPIYKFTEGPDFKKPDLLVVGDSYWWPIVGDDLPIHFFMDDEYWFYNKDQIIRNKKEKQVSELNLSASISNRDVIMIMATEATMYMFPYGFIDNTYKLYCSSGERKKEIINYIKSDTAWYNSVLSKAAQNNISIEKQLLVDAEYTLAEELAKQPDKLQQMMEQIKNDPVWFKKVQDKAAENKIPVDQQLKLDAQWALDNP